MQLVWYLHGEKAECWSGDGKDRKVSVSYEEKDIVEPKDLMILAKSKEVIIISPWGYNRVKKVPYYEDRIIKKKADEVIEYNQSISSM